MNPKLPVIVLTCLLVPVLWGSRLLMAAGAPELPGNWKELGVGESISLYERFDQSQQSQETDAAKSQMALHAWSKFLANDQAAERLEASALADLVWITGPVLNEAQRKQLTAHLSQRYQKNPGIWLELDAQRFQNRLLATAIQRLGMPVDEPGRLLIGYIKDGKVWRNSPPGPLQDLLWMLRDLKQGTSLLRGLCEAEDILIGYFWDNYLADTKRIEKLQPKDVIALSHAVFYQLGDRRKGQLYGAFMDYMESRPDSFWKDLQVWKNPNHARQVSPWLLAHKLNLPAERIARWGVRWVSTSDAWRQPYSATDWPHKDLHDFADLIEATVEGAKSSDLEKNRATVYGAIAQEVIRRLRQGTNIGGSDVCFGCLGLTLSSSEYLPQLRETLLDELDLVRPEAARLMAWASWRAGQMKDWLSLVEQKIKDPSLRPDQKAGWLLARARAAEVAGGIHTVDRVAGRPWMQQAMAMAEAEPMRMQCVQALAERYMDSELYDEALTLLAGVKGQFLSDAALSQLKVLEQQIPLRRAESQHRLVEQRRLSNDAWVRTIQQRLEAAKKAKRQDLVLQYEQILNAAH